MRPEIGTIIVGLAACSGGEPSTSDTAPVDSGTAPQVYEADWDGVQAFFADHCDSCHPATNSIDLRTDIEAFVVAGDPSQSSLWEAVQGTSISTMMPPSGRLPVESVEHIEAWIQGGAVRP